MLQQRAKLIFDLGQIMCCWQQDMSLRKWLSKFALTNRFVGHGGDIQHVIHSWMFWHIVADRIFAWPVQVPVQCRLRFLPTDHQS